MTLKELLAKKAELRKTIDSAETKEALDKIEFEMRKLDLAIEQARQEEDETRKADPVDESIETREAFGKGDTVVETIIESAKTENRATDKCDSVEYRTAFMNYVANGTPIPTEVRADATTVTGDIGAVIPTTIMNEVIKKLKVYGQLYNRVRKLNVAGGVEFPIADVIPSGTWIAETAVSDTKKTEMKTKVTFGYHVLEIRLSQTLLSVTVSLPMFEQEVTRLLAEGYVKTQEMAIINGTGSGQPLGILKDTRVPSTNKISMGTSDLTWKGYKSVFGKMPLASRAEGIIITTNANWEQHMDGLVDTTGQPIARTTNGIDGTQVLRFNGREVVLVENDIGLADYDSAAADAAWAIIMPATDYAINSNMQMQMTRYFDQNTNKWISKGLSISDGKLLQTERTFILTKKAAASGG